MGESGEAYASGGAPREGPSARLGLLTADPRAATFGVVQHIFSVDVEDWFHILDLPDAPDLAAWAELPSHVEKNFRVLLDLFSERGIHVTCFFLGWVAERFPHLVREAVARGHEVASHGYAHQLVYALGPDSFLEDIKKAKGLIEDAAGREVRGYRCPGFSVTESTPWFFDKVAEAGYRYDSSVFPAPRGHGGLRSDKYAPYTMQTAHGPLVEFPITVVKVLGRPMCLFGGGYLRLAPYPLVREAGKLVTRERRPVVFYLHPREIDPEQPRMDMPPLRRFKSYINVEGTREKVRRILQDFDVGTFERWLATNPVAAG